MNLRILLLLLAGSLAGGTPALAQPDTYRLRGTLSLEVQAVGGAFSRVSLPGDSLNPLSWALTSAQMPANNQAGGPFRGHFLCLGRWGAPTAGEMAAGLPHNGDHHNRRWEATGQGPDWLHLRALAPLDQYLIEREIVLDPESPVFAVTEHITHTGTTGRLSNVVQHPTLGPPFLHPGTRINTNAGAGFLQSLSYPDPHAYAYRWPEGVRDSSRQPLDLRRSDLPVNYVSTHCLDDSVTYGWVTAYDPRSRRIFGYIWPASDYPWLNVWHHQVDGTPVAKGLEFGTAGIGRPYQDLLAHDTRFHGRASYLYHDAGETLTRRYWGFWVAVEADIEEVRSVQMAGKELVITGQHGAVYRWPLSIGE